jgi:hypothetical protein
MTIHPVTFATDRSMAVPPGAVVRTAHVPIEDVVLACRDRMAVGDVDRAYQKRLQLGNHHPWPCPRGRWNDSRTRFIVEDGRHEFVASLMLGHPTILVAWIEADGARQREVTAA